MQTETTDTTTEPQGQPEGQAPDPAGQAAPPAGDQPPAGKSGDDIEELVKSLQQDPEGLKRLIEHKRGFNAREKEMRLRAEAAEAKAQKLETERQRQLEEAENAKLSEKERLEKQLGQLNEQLQLGQSKTQQYEQQIFALQVENLAIRESAQDPEYIQFQLQKHLGTLDDQARQAFGLEQAKAWMTELKKTKPEAFRPAATQPGQTRPNPDTSKPAGQRRAQELPENLRNPKTFSDVQKLNASIQETIRSIGRG